MMGFIMIHPDKRAHDGIQNGQPGLELQISSGGRYYVAIPS